MSFYIFGIGDFGEEKMIVNDEQPDKRIRKGLFFMKKGNKYVKILIILNI